MEDQIDILRRIVRVQTTGSGRHLLPAEIEAVQWAVDEIMLLKEKLRDVVLHKVGPRQRNVESQEG